MPNAQQHAPHRNVYKHILWQNRTIWKQNEVDPSTFKLKLNIYHNMMKMQISYGTNSKLIVV